MACNRKKKTELAILVSSILLLMLGLATRAFFRVHYLNLSDVTVLRVEGPPKYIRPYAFEICKCSNNVRWLTECYPSLEGKYSWDFENYSYLIGEGMQIVAAYYSLFYTVAKDESLPWHKKPFEQVLFVDEMIDGKVYSTLDDIWDTYDKVPKVEGDGNIYIYRIKKIKNLRHEAIE